MSDNSSSSSSVLIENIFSNCFDSRVGRIIFIAFTITSCLLILPLVIIVLYLGHQRWRQKRSALTSHSDHFTYHMVVMEIIYILASTVYCIGVYFDHTMVLVVASHVFYISSCGQMSFHTLTCVERYLAVVHPITYMHLKKGRGVRIRNILILCVWLLVFAKMILMAYNSLDIILIVYIVQQAFSLAVISFCSFAVLRVLKRSGLGEGGCNRDRVNQSKQRAFNTIMVIMGTLLLRFGGCLIFFAIYNSPFISHSIRCVVIESSYWLRLPSSVVLPLLFLHRAGKLTCGWSNAE